MRNEKPWGYEEILEKNPLYVIKRLVVYPEKRLSKQYHEKKTETIIPFNGLGGIAVNNKVVKFEKDSYGFKPIHIKPKEVHRVCGSYTEKESAVFLEVSTTELEDCVRLEDDYGRVK